MTTAAVAREKIPERAPPERADHGQASYRCLVFATCTALALLINYALGKEMAWDTLDYHLYAGFSAIHDRFTNDYFAAGPASYDNPYAYVPFYALVRSGIPALAIATLLASLDSVVLCIVFELALAAMPINERRTRLAFGVLAVIFALANPILLQQIGTSFSDITTAIPVLFGLLLLTQSVREPRASKLIWAGVLIGAATGLKPTNAVHAVSAFALVAFVPVIIRVRARYFLYFGGALGVGFALVSAPWSYHLESAFGNPFFPLLNNIFRSPQFTTSPLVQYRFIPDSLASALWRPFAIANPVPLVQEELRAPDLRYAALLVVAVWALFGWLRRRVIRSSASPSSRAIGTVRPLVALSCGLCIDWVLWLRISGNGRYFLPMACVAAVVLTALMFIACEGRPKLRNYVFAAILAAQALQLWMGTDFRWNSEPWDGGPWFEVSIPKGLSGKPSLFLSLDAQADAFLAPYLPPHSGLTNVSGGYALGSGANRIHVIRLIHRYAPNVRILIRGERLHDDSEQQAPFRSDVDDALEPFGLRVDTSDCDRIVVYGLQPDIQVAIVGKNAPPVEQRPKDAVILLSCRAVADHRDHSAETAGRRLANLALDHLEDSCPQLFQPRRLFTEQSGDTTRGFEWSRLYLNTDLKAWVSRGWVKFQNSISGDPMVVVGRESDWANARLALSCGRRDGHYFANLLKW